MKKYDQALRYEIFEKEEYAVAKEAIQQANVIFDIGGHLGFFSEWCRSLWSEAEIHYFEPIEELYQEAKSRLNGEKKLIFNNVWIGVEEGEISFLVNDEKTMQSSKYASFLNSKWEEVKVKMTTLERYLDSLEPPLPPVANTGQALLQKEGIFVKMDIEGMEWDVLESWSEEIWEMIGSLIVEVHFLKEGDEERFLRLKEKLNQIFGTVVYQENAYSEKVGLLYGRK